MTVYPYQDPARSIAERVDDLAGRMSLAEKIGQLTQYFYMGRDDTPVTEEMIASLPEELRDFARQPARVGAAIDAGRVGSLLFVTDPAMLRRLQERALAGSRWGIPLLFGFDVIHGLRTIFPVPIAAAASWDPEIVAASQRAAAREASAVGIRWTFAPMVDIARDPRWGRMVEGAGEDPCLGAAMAAAQVRGFQGGMSGTGEEAIGPESILAGPKHFAGYGAPAGGRDYEEVELSQSLLHNVYLPPFQAAIDAGAGNIMAAYMELDGVPAAANHHLLSHLLRDELGFDGFVVSDADAVNKLLIQHLVRTPAEAAARAVAAGLDMEMAQLGAAFEHLEDAVAQGLIDAAAIDAAARRVLTAKFRLGLFEQPFGAAPETAQAVLADPSHRRLARQAAERSLVLLKNDGALPLTASARRIAVLGDLAASKRDILGPWTFEKQVEESVSILEGIRARAGAGVTVEYARALATASRVQPSIFDRQEQTPLPTTPEGFDADAEMERAVALAAGADVAIVVVGQNQNMIGEAASTSTLSLPGRQEELIARVTATGTPTIVLVMSGRPLDIRAADDGAAAILQVWYPGTRGGAAVAAALFGDVSPAGRLPFTWPRHVGQVPMHYAHHTTFAPQDADRRYWNEQTGAPLYSFGHGLSYASFEYRDVQVPDRLAIGETGTARVTVTNTSDVDADEVVQLYLHQRYGSSTRPVRELKGFRRVHVPAGQTVTVDFPLGPQQLRYWSAATGTWVQEPTTIDVAVGGSSAVPFTAQFEVTA
ncbi:glycoside hydrolase family 3 N-terminal domain-containing protein [Actinomyces sp. MRS3W]|uniref:glycoside hydrolase family 3 N-terminal domain-containing protein n=1 Tax=Actinomyces sp. MRS3W TaxID=2800796 RepID=UPI0028FD2B67|nr:glycoside hydrolase family 3 N-terminal domain-containing protein [Actinomyces sp. MRS3W]MDU0348929.1 glycoside hydrolase family 3 N-terminal domain-containing protein [Actinomyces sp. MRS3W]